MEIVMIRIEEIRPYKNNPRINDGPAVDKVAHSIEQFGFKVPIILDKTKEIIAGHTRYKASQQLGLKEVPCIIADDLTPKQIKAFRIADNRVAQESTWDHDLLFSEIKDLLGDFTIEDLGFDTDELKAIDDDTEPEEDDYLPEPPAIPISQRGDIWILGRHRVMCGDSTNKSNVQDLMNGEEADLVVTDPPYNVDYEGQNGMKIQNDKMGDTMFREFLVESFDAMNSALKAGGAFYIWHADSEGFNFRGACHDIGWKVRQCLIWNKNSLVMGRQDYHWKHEPCLYGWKDGAGHYWYGSRSQTTVIEDEKALDLRKMKKDELLDLAEQLLRERKTIETTVIDEKKPSANDLHPTMKPIRLIGRLILNSSRKGEKVLDTFGGSGSTLIASEQLGRDCFMMEIDERYTDVVVDRYISFRGNSEDVFLIREGRKTPYNETKKR